MAGRGRGRGKANLSFDIGSLGFGAGETLPTQTLQPPSTYPVLQQRPTPLASSEVDEYLLALSQEYRGSIKDSPFYLKPKTVKKDIVRYTDRYKQTNQRADSHQWEPDWTYFPHELKPTLKRKPVGRRGGVNLAGVKKRNVVDEKTKEDVVKKLDELVQKEGTEGENETEKQDEEGQEEEELEEEFEDDNDYNFDYYNDGGDNYEEGEEGGEDGPVY